MSLCIINSILVGFAFLVFYFTGWFRVCVHGLFRLIYRYHLDIRRSRRPGRIFIIRHGESQANVDHTICATVGDSDVELTERGHQQAIAAGEKLRSMIGDESVYVYMSPYKRSQQTWVNIRKALSPSQIITERQDPRIREQELGNLVDLEAHPQQLEDQERLGHFFYRFSCGESGADVYDRASLFLDTIFREMNDGHHDATQNIVIVSHGFFMCLFLMRYFRWNIDVLKTIKHFENCEICELTKINGVYTLDGHTMPPTKES